MLLGSLQRSPDLWLYLRAWFVGGNEGERREREGRDRGGQEMGHPAATPHPKSKILYKSLSLIVS